MRMAMVAAEIPSAVHLSAPVGSRSSLDWARTKDIADQFIAAKFRDIAEFVIDVSDLAALIGHSDNCGLVDRALEIGKFL